MVDKSQKRVPSFGVYSEHYKAQKMAKSLPGLDVQVEEISKWIKKLIDEKHIQQYTDITDLLNSANRKLRDGKDDILRRLLSFGNLFDTFLHMHYDKIKAESEKIAKMIDRISYHFLMAAKESGDKEMLTTAIKIGNKVE